MASNPKFPSEQEAYYERMAPMGGQARVLHGRRGGGGTGASAAHPDQHFTVLIGGEPLALDQFNLQILQRFIIEPKLPLERAIGHPPPLP